MTTLECDHCGEETEVKELFTLFQWQVCYACIEAFDAWYVSWWEAGRKVVRDKVRKRYKL